MLGVPLDSQLQLLMTYYDVMKVLELNSGVKFLVLFTVHCPFMRQHAQGERKMFTKKLKKAEEIILFSLKNLDIYYWCFLDYSRRRMSGRVSFMRAGGSCYLNPSQTIQLFFPRDAVDSDVTVECK